MVQNLYLQNILTEEDVTKLDAAVFAKMQAAYDNVKEHSSEKDMISNATPEEVHCRVSKRS